MDVSDLLTELAATERKLRELEQAAPAPPGGRCWPAWRILLHHVNDPAALDEWWQAHGSMCPECMARHRRVAAPQEAPRRDRLAPRRVRTIPIAFDATCDRPMAFAAATAARLESPATELPVVEYHRLEGACTLPVDAVWLVTWDHMLYVLITGPDEALQSWREADLVLESGGARIADLRPANDEAALMLSPCPADPTRSTLVYQCQLPVRELLGQSFSIPNLVPEQIRLAPRDAKAPLLEDLMDDLVSRNRVGRFLAGLPEHVGNPARALTLSLYLRILVVQGRITDLDKLRLRELDWLAQDVKDALGPGGDSEL